MSFITHFWMHFSGPVRIQDLALSKLMVLLSLNFGPLVNNFLRTLFLIIRKYPSEYVYDICQHKITHHHYMVVFRDFIKKQLNSLY